MARTVNIHLGDEDYIRIGMNTHAGSPGHLKLYEAIGYLSSWNTNYPTVDIYRDNYGPYDLIAVYSNADGSRGYTIGAVWDVVACKYGFHS